MQDQTRPMDGQTSNTKEALNAFTHISAKFSHSNEYLFVRVTFPSELRRSGDVSRKRKAALEGIASDNYLRLMTPVSARRAVCPPKQTGRWPFQKINILISFSPPGPDKVEVINDDTSGKGLNGIELSKVP